MKKFKVTREYRSDVFHADSMYALVFATNEKEAKEKANELLPQQLTKKAILSRRSDKAEEMKEDGKELLEE